MVPFQTFLALLALLVLTSCSQTSPPHTEVEKLSQKESATLNDSPTSTVPVVKPESTGDGTPVPTVTKYDFDTPGVSLVTVTGNTAKVMYDLLAVKVERLSVDKHKYSFKQGSQFTCTLDNGDASCSFTVSDTDGSILNSKSPNEVLPGTAKLTLDPKGFPDTNLFVVDQSKSQTQWVRVWMMVNSKTEKAMYENLQQHANSVTPSADGVTTENEKVGESIYCNNQLPKDWYSCYVYLDVSNGSAARVSDARPVFDAK